MYSVPILLNIFNRPESTQKVLSVIREIQPTTLYVHADGPRTDKLDESVICTKCRELIKSMVDWDCDLHIWYEDTNKGCGKGPAEAITWFFQNVEYGIILEDDCVPNYDFFLFMEDMLLRYKDETKITSVAGSNFQDGHKRGDASYYFSQYNRIWGWATWKRVWSQYDYYMSDATTESIETVLYNCFSRKCDRQYWSAVLKTVLSNRMNDTCWDYQFMFLQWRLGGLTVTPNCNLVSNIGDGPDATHTAWENNPNLNRKVDKLYPIHYPKIVKVDVKADNYYMDNYILYRKNLLQRFVRKVRKIMRKML